MAEGSAVTPRVCFSFNFGSKVLCCNKGQRCCGVVGAQGEPA